MSRLGTVLREALGSLRESPGVAALTSGTIAAALLVFGGYLMALENLESLARVWGRSAAVTAYVRDTVPAEHWDAIRLALVALPGVRVAELVTPGEALERFRARGPEAAALVEGVPEHALPATIELEVDEQHVAVDDVRALASLASRVEGVGEVDYGQEELDELQLLLDVLRWVGAVLGMFVALATAMIISNTIRLTVYARRDEIGILSLVGATPGYVRAPFLVEGAIWGVTGGLLAAATMAIADLLAAAWVSRLVASALGGVQVRMVSVEATLAMVVAGALLGVLGSSLAVSRFLDRVGRTP